MVRLGNRTLCDNLRKYRYISVREVRNDYSTQYQDGTEPQKGGRTDIDTCRPSGALVMVATLYYTHSAPLGLCCSLIKIILH